MQRACELEDKEGKEAPHEALACIVYRQQHAKSAGLPEFRATSPLEIVPARVGREFKTR